ncbi:MAG: bifunctional oligoribonuclease/PAP phosphatase NrnA [Acidobacteria bacterium]|nr:bifunctional oligoribonuclease/PAP phosphatase NrnA [Acidobacteriota bacterium]
MLSQVVELIESKRRFAITSHIRPDGDSLGSSLGLYWLLRALDKEPEVIMRDPVPHSYLKLPGAEFVRVTPGVDRPYDAVFVIECSEIDRPGLNDLESQLVVNIDHHSTTALFGAINWIDSTASAVGEMIYNLCKAIGVRVTREIAECVYTALVTDTGSFHYSNTTERTFKVASELVRAGVKPAKVSQAVFGNYPWSKIALTSSVLATVKRDASGRVAWLRQTQEMQQLAGASDEDGDGLVNYPLSCGEVEAGRTPQRRRLHLPRQSGRGRECHRQAAHRGGRTALGRGRERRRDGGTAAAAGDRRRRREAEHRAGCTTLSFLGPLSPSSCGMLLFVPVNF